LVNLLLQSGHGGNWHPSAGMHLLRAETMAYNYAYILLDALNEVDVALKAGHSRTTLLEGWHSWVLFCCRLTVLAEYQRKLDVLQVPAPDYLYCGEECIHRPTCYTDWRPHFNPKYFLEDIIIGQNGWNRIRKPNMLDQKYGHLEARDAYDVS
jgi:hypothetical protein